MQLSFTGELCLNEVVKPAGNVGEDSILPKETLMEHGCREDDIFPYGCGDRTRGQFTVSLSEISRSVHCLCETENSPRCPCKSGGSEQPMSLS